MAREFWVDIEWVPFELHPEIPDGGLPREDLRLPQRPGVGDYLRELAADAGLPMRSNPTVANGHRALEATEWARAQGRDPFDRLHRALFHAYFAQARNISTRGQVLDVVRAAGLDADACAAALDAGAFRAHIDELTQVARAQGIQGTPVFIFDDRYMVQGCQDYAVFADVLTRLGVPRRAGADPGDSGAASSPPAAPGDLIDPAGIDGPSRPARSGGDAGERPSG